MRYERAAKLDARIDTDTGEFDMVMATEGEASDGHILSIEGLETGEEVPLQLDHGRSAVSNLGTVTNFRKGSDGGVPVLRGTGRIRLSGDGEALAARRDLVDAIRVGDVSGVSLSWDSERAVARKDLPRNHHAHVPRSESNLRKRHGLYFEQSRALEQSIVGIPADRNALIGRAESAEDAISRAVWQTMAERLDERPAGESAYVEALEAQVADLEERLRAAEAPASSDDEPDVAALETVLRSIRTDWRERTRRELRDSFEEIRRAVLRS